MSFRVSYGLNKKLIRRERRRTRRKAEEQKKERERTIELEKKNGSGREF
jgi:hypothetical protein